MRILVAGVGNTFLGDDGFGVEVARRLALEPLGDDVQIADFGVRGVHLAYELLDGRYDAAILVDVMSRGGRPGTLYAMTHDPAIGSYALGDAHAQAMTPNAVLAWVRRVGVPVARVVVLGCEPMSISESIGLSAPVAASIDDAMEMIRELVAAMKAVPSCA
jgi:hydrogenase maturation protease